MNNNMIDSTCPRCCQTETWHHVIKCSDTKKHRAKFISKMIKEMIKQKPEDVHIDEIMSFLEDTLRHAEGENNEECETNQCCIGMQNLFRGCVIKDWVGTNFSTTKHRNLNKIVARKCAEYYNKCWIQRNEVSYNEIKHKERIVE